MRKLLLFLCLCVAAAAAATNGGLCHEPAENILTVENEPVASVDRPRMVEKGKTWWYRKKQALYPNVFNYGVSIGDEVELDGEMWNEVNVVLCGLTDKTGATRFDRIPQTVAYVREADGKIMSRVLKKNQYEGLIEEIRLWYNIAPHGYWIDEEDSDFCLMDWDKLVAGEEVLLGNKNGPAAIGCYFRLNGTEIIENSGKEYTVYKLDPVGEDNAFTAHIREFVPELGLDFYNHFFMPFVAFTTIGPESYTFPYLTYVTDPEGEVIYEELGGEKLWEMAGVDLPTVEGQEPVRWYNLQGLEISEPHSAGIYIRRQGLEAQKVMVE